MDRSAVKAMPAEELLFREGLGDRPLSRDANRKPLHESLLLRTELSGVPSFDFALSERLSELDRFDHPSFARARRLLRVPGPLPRVSVVGDYAGGTRLSEVLAAMENTGTRAPVGEVVFAAREI